MQQLIDESCSTKIFDANYGKLGLVATFVLLMTVE